MREDEDLDAALEMTSASMSSEARSLEVAAGVLPSDEYLGFARALAAAEDPGTRARLVAALEERVQRAFDAVARREEWAATLAHHVFRGNSVLRADPWVSARLGALLLRRLPAIRRYWRRQQFRTAHAGLARPLRCPPCQAHRPQRGHHRAATTHGPPEHEGDDDADSSSAGWRPCAAGCAVCLSLASVAPSVRRPDLGDHLLRPRSDHRQRALDLGRCRHPAGHARRGPVHLHLGPRLARDRDPSAVRLAPLVLGLPAVEMGP